MWRKDLQVCRTDLSTRNYLQDLHISTGYLKRRHRSLLALKPSHTVQTESDETNTIGAHEQRIGWIQPASSNPTLTSYAETRPSSLEKKRIRSSREGQERGPGRRRAGREWKRRARPWRWPSGSFWKGHWAPARWVVVGFGEVAIRRSRRAALLGSLLSILITRRTFFICFIFVATLAYPSRWLYDGGAWCAKGGTVVLPWPVHAGSLWTWRHAIGLSNLPRRVQCTNCCIFMSNLWILVFSRFLFVLYVIFVSIIASIKYKKYKRSGT